MSQTNLSPKVAMTLKRMIEKGFLGIGYHIHPENSLNYKSLLHVKLLEKKGMALMIEDGKWVPTDFGLRQDLSNAAKDPVDEIMATRRDGHAVFYADYHGNRRRMRLLECDSYGRGMTVVDDLTDEFVDVDELQDISAEE